MKKIIATITATRQQSGRIDITLLFFRIAVSVELILAHGLKKLGIGVASAEVVPNPLHLPQALNQLFAESANLLFPVFVMLGLFTRLTILPILAVTLTGYFVVHLHDPIIEKDMPYMYSIAYLLLWFIGPGKYSLDYFIHKKIQS